jgi:predicted outer membrane protein
MSRQLWTTGIWGIAVAVATSAVAIAAPPQQRENDPQQAQPQQRPQTFAHTPANRAMAGKYDLDHLFVKVLNKANKDEIQLGQLAQQNSQNPAVKQLAMQMVQDHNRFMEKLNSFKGTEHQSVQTQTVKPQSVQPQGGFNFHFQQPTQGGAAFRGETENNANQQPQQPAQNQQNSQQPGVAGNNNQQQPGSAGNPAHHRMEGGEHTVAAHFARIMEEVDQNMQQSLVKDLSSKQGTQFDRCYLSSQLFGHMWVVEALKTFDQNASPQLKPILQEGLQTSEQHLAHLKSLLAKLDNETPARSSATLQPRGGVTR